MRFEFTEVETGAPFVNGNLEDLEVVLKDRAMTIMDFADALQDCQLAGTIKYAGGKVEAYPRVYGDLDRYIEAVQERIAVQLKATGRPVRPIPGSIEARDWLEQLWNDGVPVYPAAMATLDEWIR
ncbi:hypothetical protein BF49_5624 [Bradyrhizobium sp.]|uniref:hypothetical protein n=1 Tax=Bradyrhizobium sp. TaxID=376 RepID=UPI0007C1906C|nr:hypothetical protein [Bradyrhizobium sp.]CUT14544.1 hypothetical protein BF49_5624 [Bradyrhizobium sp.]